jgi:error-prone DNA polymerase
VEAALGAGQFRSVADFVDRTGLDERALRALAEAGAFEDFLTSRRDALWQVQGLSRGARAALPFDTATDTATATVTTNTDAGTDTRRRVAEEGPEFPPLDAFETIAWDYRATSSSPRGHPLEPLRNRLRALGLPDARTVASWNHGRRVRYAGLVICRQRPGTASGVVFMTLEDETGFVNLVLWPTVFDAFSVIARTQSFLGVTGRLQVADGVVHLVAESLWEPHVSAEPATVGSRDFH